MIWYLESRSPEDTHPSFIPLHRLPFRIGRRWDLDLALPSPQVSWEHAEIFEEGGELKIRDLGSSNGTCVNGRRVLAAEPLAEGDVLQIALREYRLGRTGSREELRHPTTELVQPSVPQSLIEQAIRFSELMRARAVEVLFQPIVRLRKTGEIGFEVLGRGGHDGLPKSPLELLEVASRLGVAAELSQLFRSRGLEVAARFLPAGTRLFANTHPAELENPAKLLRALRDLRERAPGAQLTLEVHEGAVTGLAALRELRARLRDLDVQLAFDDFGAGQSRLLELAEAPPDVLKLDAALIRGLERASAARLSVVGSILRVAADLGILTVAEGVETGAVLDACRELGFDAAQGFLCGVPAPVAALAEAGIPSSVHSS